MFRVPEKLVISVRHVVIAFVVITAVIGELALSSLGSGYNPKWYYIAVAFVAAMLLVIKPRFGQWLMLIVLFAMTALNDTPHIIQVTFAATACADAIVRDSRLVAWVTALFPSLGILFFDSDTATAAVWLSINLIVLILSYAVRRIIRDREAARQRALAVERETHRRLAIRIHDTTARDLSRILINLDEYQARSCEENRSPDRQMLNRVENDLRATLSTLRSLISELDGLKDSQSSDQSPVSVGRIIAIWKEKLAANGMELSASYPPTVESLPVSYQKILADLIAELAANAHKYAAANSVVDLTIEIDAEDITVEQSNRIKVETIPEQARGGTGLRRLSYVLGKYGGDVASYSVGDMWIAIAHIPAPSAAQ